MTEYTKNSVDDDLDLPGVEGVGQTSIVRIKTAQFRLNLQQQRMWK